MNIPAHFDIGPLTIHFYGLMYATAAVSAFFVTKWFAARRKEILSADEIIDVIFWTLLFGVLGGRIFYVFIYNFGYFFHNPLQIYAVWNGGMSIHGGLLGGSVGVMIAARKIGKPLLTIADLFMPALALGLAFGRFGNFVNGELAGRVTAAPWGMDFGDGQNRHPAQLYAVLKDIVLALIITGLGLRKRFASGILTGVFFCTLAVFRFLVEFFREPDSQLGLIGFGLSMGQWLSVALLVVGLGILAYTSRAKKRTKNNSR